jgi:uncharacterized protein YbjT (DUF2867 family)
LLENKVCSRCENQAIGRCDQCKAALCFDHTWRLGVRDYDRFRKNYIHSYSVTLNLCEKCAREKLDEDDNKYTFVSGKRQIEYLYTKKTKITIFGATGGTGKQLVEQALTAGYKVVAYIRDPSKFKISHNNLSIIQGELSDYSLIESAVKGSNAVISTLGSRVNSKNMPLTQGMRNIVEAMKKQGVSRLIVTSTLSLTDPKDLPNLRNKIRVGIVKLSKRGAYDDIVGVAETVRGSDLDWTIIRLGMPNDGPKSGEVRTGYVGTTEVGMNISRGDIADFLLRQVQDTKYLRQTPVISN